MSQNGIFLVVLAVGAFFLFKDKIFEFFGSLTSKIPAMSTDDGMSRFMRLRDLRVEYEKANAKDVTSKLDEAIEIAVKFDLLTNK